MVGLNSSGNGGEIIEVKGGGHIIRSTNRKDRHSKVYTSKGARDRRVRLAAHTAIKFYDVQDRLGYDRPSKAVDWLIKNAQFSIDKLARLPQIHPSMRHGFEFQSPIAPDTTSFQEFPLQIISKGTNETEDLCLSLHSSQGPQELNQDAGFFSGGESMGRYQRMVFGWENGGLQNKSGFAFHSPHPQPQLTTVQGPQFSQQSFFSVPIAGSSEDYGKGVNNGASFGEDEYSRGWENQ